MSNIYLSLISNILNLVIWLLLVTSVNPNPRLYQALRGGIKSLRRYPLIWFKPKDTSFYLRSTHNILLLIFNIIYGPHIIFIIILTMCKPCAHGFKIIIFMVNHIVCGFCILKIEDWLGNPHGLQKSLVLARKRSHWSSTYQNKRIKAREQRYKYRQLLSNYENEIITLYFIKQIYNAW